MVATATATTFSSYRIDLAFVVLAVAFVLGLMLYLWQGNNIGASSTDSDLIAFRDIVNDSAELPLLRPIVVSVFERASLPLNFNDNAVGRVDDQRSNLSDSDTYNERLVVVRPNNWLIYTNNGVTFNYLTNNVSKSRLNCVNSGALSAIEYRLMRRDEVYSLDADRYNGNTSTMATTNNTTAARTLRFSCINYTFDQLTRVFTQSSNRTDIDLTDYFDKRASRQAPDFTVHAVLQFLVANNLL